MLVQALLLVAAIVLISGSIITSTIVTAKTALSHSVLTQSQTAMSDATADFVAWAQNRVRTSNSRTSWAPLLIGGKPDNTEFKRMCDANRYAYSTEPECQHAERLSWVVTGTTDTGQPVKSSISSVRGSTAENLSRPVDEQRIAAIIVADVDSANGRLTFSSSSREITARVFDATPYVVITGMRDIASSNGSIATSQGDSGGHNRNSQIFSTPNPSKPSFYTETRITTTVNCENTQDVNPNNPYSGTNLQVIGAGRDGDLDWSFQTACVPAYATPAPPNDPSYVAPVGNLYSTTDGDGIKSWSVNSTQGAFPR